MDRIYHPGELGSNATRAVIDVVRPKSYRLRVYYTVHVRIQMLHGTFTTQTIRAHANIKSSDHTFALEPIKQTLEKVLGQKLRIRRFNWENISILEVHEID